MISIRKYFHLIVLGCLALGIVLQIIDINVFTIKAFDRKMTTQNLNWKGGIYQWDETRRNITWEDGLIDFNADYQKHLQNDMDQIASLKNDIKTIDWNNQSFYIDECVIRVCTGDKDIEVMDSTIFTKIAKVKMSLQLEVYNLNGDLLHSDYDREYRYQVSNKMYFYGIGNRHFIYNKINELLYSELCDLVGDHAADQRRKAMRYYLRTLFQPRWYSIRSQTAVAQFQINDSNADNTVEKR